MTDPISDLLTRIRNAYLANHTKVTVPHSKLKQRLAKKLQSLGYLEKVDVNTKTREIIIVLKYHHKHPVIATIKRISKPGRRVYVRYNQINPTLSGHGASIISTSQGILTGKEAKKLRTGGEVICQVW